MNMLPWDREVELQELSAEEKDKVLELILNKLYLRIRKITTFSHGDSSRDELFLIEGI